MARGFQIEHDGDGFDPCRIYATPWQLTRTPPAMTRTTPKLGQHNDYVYTELLGLSADEVAALAERGVLV